LKVSRLAPWILAAILASASCHAPDTEVEQETPTTTEVEKQPPTTAKIEECSWCPASDTSGAAPAQQPASPQPDLIDQLRTAAAGTAFAEIGEDVLLLDISAVCAAWKGDTTLQGATAPVANARAELLDGPESAPGLEAYSQLLEELADQRCVRVDGES
jgi:hypothetical protein